MAQDMTIEALGDDTPLDAIENLPSFGAFLTGAYKCQMNISNKTIGEGTDKSREAIEVKFTHIETAELVEKATLELQEPTEGDSCSTLYFRGNKVAMSNFNAEIAGPVAAKFGAKTIGEVIAKGNGTNVLAVLKREWSDKDKKNYMRVRNIIFL